MPAVLAPNRSQAISAAVRFLLDRQGADGAWRSDTYGAFKDGGSLTPLVLHALLAATDAEAVRSSVGRGLAYLAGLIRPDGSLHGVPYGLSYPAYTAALAVLVFSQPGGAGHAG